MLATVLFTDIVGSTERARELGDRRWRRPARARTTRRVRRELARFRGREIDTAGDGFLASFDGPARAIRCALAAVDARRRGSVSTIRAGVHTGECEVVDDKLGGIAVHIGARVAGARRAGRGARLGHGARPGRRLGHRVRGPRRSPSLKGVPEPRRLFAVAR